MKTCQKKMKFRLEENIELYKELTNLYENSVIRDLEAAEKELVKNFEIVLDANAVNFDLVTNSSIERVPYYTVKSRVKKVKSFSEKLIRKDLGISLCAKFGATKEKLLENKVNLCNEIKKLDDIVGLRIVTELREDTVNAYQLIKYSAANFAEKKVIFHDLRHQPQVMKNGLKIYRIKGEYDGLVSFELQIKSKIDEAWGEIDHRIFYKNHSSSSSLIRPTVQATMNNVGFILESLENLLYDLRRSAQVFEANSSYIEFENMLFKNYNESLAEIFKQPVPLAEFAKIIFFFKKQMGIDAEFAEPLNFDFLSYEIADGFYKKLLDLCHDNHNLIIVEAFYHILLKTESEHDQITIENYEERFKNFANLYFDYFKQEVDEDDEFLSSNFRIVLEKNYEYLSNNEVL